MVLPVRINKRVHCTGATMAGEAEQPQPSTLDINLLQLQSSHWHAGPSLTLDASVQVCWYFRNAMSRPLLYVEFIMSFFCSGFSFTHRGLCPCCLLAWYHGKGWEWLSSLPEGWQRSCWPSSHFLIILVDNNCFAIYGIHFGLCQNINLSKNLPFYQETETTAAVTATQWHEEAVSLRHSPTYFHPQGSAK